MAELELTVKNKVVQLKKSKSQELEKSKSLKLEFFVEKNEISEKSKQIEKSKKLKSQKGFDLFEFLRGGPNFLCCLMCVLYVLLKTFKVGRLFLFGDRLQCKLH